MLVAKKEYTIQGHKLILRNTDENEAQSSMDFIKIVCGETLFLKYNSSEIKLTLDDEKNFIKRHNDAENDLLLIATLDGEYAGNCLLMSYDNFKDAHKATLGIALYQKYTGMGIGKIMFERLIEIARELGLEYLELSVNGDNKRAISLYKKSGFIEYGRFPYGIRYGDSYTDKVFMYLKL